MNTSTVKIVYSFRGTPNLNNELFGALNGNSPGVIEEIELSIPRVIYQKTPTANGLIIVPPTTNLLPLALGGDVTSSPPGSVTGGTRISANFPTFLSLLADPLTPNIPILLAKWDWQDITIIPIKLIWL